MTGVDIRSVTRSSTCVLLVVPGRESSNARSPFSGRCWSICLFIHNTIVWDDPGYSLYFVSFPSLLFSCPWKISIGSISSPINSLVSSFSLSQCTYSSPLTRSVLLWFRVPVLTRGTRGSRRGDDRYQPVSGVPWMKYGRGYTLSTDLRVLMWCNCIEILYRKDDLYLKLNNSRFNVWRVFILGQQYSGHRSVGVTTKVQGLSPCECEVFLLIDFTKYFYNGDFSRL